MPYAFQTHKIKLPRSHDRRVKITEEHKLQIKDLFFNEHTPIREIARRFEKICSRKSIQYILFPERQRKNYALRVKNGGSKRYYKKEKHTVAIRTHRQYKQKVLNKTICKKEQ